MTDEVVVVVAGGAPPPVDAVRDVPRGAPVIAADSGLENARALGLEPTTAIGDFDSVSPETLADAAAAGVRIVRHPEAKDATDLELALDAAVELRPTRIHVLAGDAGRLDHLLAALLLLASPRYATVPIDATFGRARVHVVRGERMLVGAAGEVVSLVALNGTAEGVTTHGLEYPLHNEMLEPGSSRGVSNVFTDTDARVQVDRGVLLAIRPAGENP
jgi:thiamine pyrophosphokinase